jgi:glycosyltransferase involved in cell wall biosynthesis
VEFTGPVAYSAIGGYFDRTRVFVNTSSVEGFPNTFLQAWIRGVPVVTFFDPDDLIARRKLGAKVSNLEQMTRAVATLAADEALRRSVGARAAQFASEQYSMSAVARSYLDLFNRRFGSLDTRAELANVC